LMPASNNTWTHTHTNSSMSVEQQYPVNRRCPSSKAYAKAVKQSSVGVSRCPSRGGRRAHVCICCIAQLHPHAQLPAAKSQM
jgi:hypothetical protein